MEISGKLIQKLPLQSGVGKTGTSWQKQEFVIETIETYPKKICANLWGEKTEALNALNIGDQVIMTFNLESREFNGKWYTKVKAWKVVVDKAAEPQKAPEPEYQTQFTDDPQTDDLPF